MSVPTRAFSAALLIAAVSLGGALYLQHGRSPASAGLDGTATSVAALDRDALPVQVVDESILDSAFHRVEEQYYKPVDTQALIDGESHELTALMKKNHVKDAQLPAVAATGLEEKDTDLINQLLHDAIAESGSKIPANDLSQAAIHGMLSSLGDPYTDYLTRKQIEALEESLRGGDFGGIGVYIVQDTNKRILIDPIEGTPAYRAGLKPGDQILSVNGNPTGGQPLDEVEKEIRGRIGTVVTLVVKPYNGKTSRTVAVTRDRILVPSVHAKMENGIEYVRLSDFGETSYDEVRKAMLSGKDQHATGYILDLRNNGGGLLDAAVKISSLFIPDGTIVSTIDRSNSKDSKQALGTSIGVAPLVVLVNKYTASASEITSGAIQDYKVGTLIGTKTFGKGVVQSIFNTADGGALKITTQRYVTPLGRDIHHKGIEPDIVLDQQVDAPIIDTSKDVQLAAAKSYIRKHASQ